MNELTLNEATQEIIRIHNGMRLNRIQIKEQKRKYNNLVRKNLKLLKNEPLMQREYCKMLDKNKIEYIEQVLVPNGRIDVLTKSHLIELKIKSHDSIVYQAIGQLEYYICYYPSHDKKIVLLTEPSIKSQNILKLMNIEMEIFECQMNYF